MNSLDWCEMSWKKGYSSLLPSSCVSFMCRLQVCGLKKATLVLQNQKEGAHKHTGQTGMSAASEFKTVNDCDF